MEFSWRGIVSHFPLNTRIWVLSAIALLVNAWFSVGYYHPDEHFQILEFAGLKMGMNTPANLPWEYHSQMRPAFQPAVAVGMYDLTQSLDIDNPFIVAWMLRLLSSMLSFAAMFAIYLLYRDGGWNKTTGRWFLWMSFLMWFVIFNNTRFSSESWSGAWFILAFALFMSKKPKRRTIVSLLTGVLLGLSFICRYQAGIMIAGFLLWAVFIRRESFRNLLLLALGMLLADAAGVLIDRWFYGEWVFTSWNYYYENLFLDKISGFGIQPWYFYLVNVFLFGIPPFSLIYLAGILVFFIFRWKDPVTWILFPFLLVHFLIGHKEIRFMFPVIGFIPVIVARALQVLSDRWGDNVLHTRFSRITARAFWITNFAALLLVSFFPARSDVRLYQVLYNRYPKPVNLYYLDGNPYQGTKEIRFYKRPTLTLVKADSIGEINGSPDSLCLFVTRKPAWADLITRNKREVYSSFPPWITKFDFNGWVGRTSFWHVYEVRKGSSQVPDGKL